ncbi:MAG TPA: hypothetical protein P5223_04075, partial [Phycisphaerae bacterium]|nr:hypothetical protein [Phycisphaerae bacterium]
GWHTIAVRSGIIEFVKPGRGLEANLSPNHSFPRGLLRPIIAHAVRRRFYTPLSAGLRLLVV